LKFTRGDTKVAFEKLWYLQRKHTQHYATLDPSTVDPRKDLNLLAVKPIVKSLEERRSRQELPTYEALQPGAPREHFVRSLLLADARNYTNPEQFINRSISFFSPPTKESLQKTILDWNWKLHYVPRETNKKISPSEFLELLEVYDQIPEKTWNKGELKFWTDTIIKSMLMKSIDETPELTEDEALTLSFQKAWGAFLHKYIRWATMGARSGPDGSVAMSILGREETLRRFALAKKVVLETYGEDGEVRRDDHTADGAVMTGMLMGDMTGLRVTSGGAIGPEPGLAEGPVGGGTSEDVAVPSEMDGDEAVPDEEDVFLEDEAQRAEESSWDWGEDGNDGDGFDDRGV
jgi:glutamyl-tRNA synthetase